MRAGFVAHPTLILKDLRRRKSEKSPKLVGDWWDHRCRRLRRGWAMHALIRPADGTPPGITARNLERCVGASGPIRVLKQAGGYGRREVLRFVERGGWRSGNT